MKFDLMKFTLKKQKHIMLSTIVFSGLWIAYGLIFATPFYGLSYFSNEGGLLYAKGAEIYRDIQPFNKALFDLVIALFVLAAITYIYFSHKRRIYYLSNYISLGAYTLLSFFIAIYNLINVVLFAIQYSAIDFDTVNLLASVVGQPYTPSYYMFVVGILMSIASLAQTALVALLAFSKYSARKKELIERNSKEAANA